MAKTIVVNVTPEESRMAIFEEKELIEIAVERTKSGHHVGNIYKGKTKNVLPGMQAAFIDIGKAKMHSCILAMPYRQMLLIKIWIIR